MNLWDDEPPPDLGPWSAAGFRRVAAKEWVRWRFPLAEAQAWRAAGVTRALTAAQWRTAAVTPQTVRQWRDAGIDASAAVRWHEFGMDLDTARRLTADGVDPSSVKLEASYTKHPLSERERRRQEQWERFQNAGVPGQVLSSYWTAQWFDDDALAWARRGIVVEHARLWARLGLRPAEAAGLDAAPAEIVARWWGAGIPFDEVADWIGAGLTPAEAVEQRAAGVTQEQAAALRALRAAAEPG